MRYQVEEIRRGFDRRRESQEGRGARVRGSGRDVIGGKKERGGPKTREKAHKEKT